MKKSQLIEFAEKTGKRTEEHFPQSNIETKKTWWEYEIGIELQEFVWYWWEICSFGEKINDEEEMWFRNRYNMKNGHEIKAFHTGFIAEMKIKRYLNAN